MDLQIPLMTLVVLVALALAFGLAGDVKLGPTSLGAALLLACYVGGMRLVYQAGRTRMHLEDIPRPAGGARRAWIGFLVSAAVVIVAGRYLAASADAIAETSGISASFIGVLLVSLVTTLPEMSVTVAACLRRSYGIAMGNIYGSNAFNATVPAFADLLSDTPLLGEMQREHYAAALGALALMGLGYAVWGSVRAGALARARALAPAIPALYVAALYAVYALAQST
jgi:cation:H+ antiporter